jgi:hypothetical protein
MVKAGVCLKALRRFSGLFAGKPAPTLTEYDHKFCA